MIGVVVVAIIVVVAVMMHGSGTPGASNVPSSTATSGNTTPGSSPMSLKDLLTAGISQQCAFSTQNPNSETVAGTVYVTAGHLRGDFNSKNASGTLTASHIITDGQTAYVWTDSPAEGFSMSFASMSSPSAAATNEMGGTINTNQAVNYSCTSWSVDASEFALPANITFTNMSAM